MSAPLGGEDGVEGGAETSFFFFNGGDMFLEGRELRGFG